MGTLNSSNAITGRKRSSGALIIADGARYREDNGLASGFAKNECRTITRCLSWIVRKAVALPAIPHFPLRETDR